MGYKNKAGFLITDLINGTFAVNYERSLGDHITLGLFAGYKTEDGLISLSGLDTDLLTTGDITYSGTKFVPEFRYYLQKKGTRMNTGFYFGSYLKFVNYTSDITGVFTNSEGASFDIAYDGKISINSIGLMVGYKLDITDRFSVDFLIMGPGASDYSFKLENRIPPPDGFYDALNEALENYSIFDLLNADFEFRDNKLDESIFLPEFRYGITLGYSF